MTVALVLTLLSSLEKLHALADFYYLGLMCMLQFFLVLTFGQFFWDDVARARCIPVEFIGMQTLALIA